MAEDWGSVKGPTFSLLTRVSPEEMASRNTFVDVIIYNRWSKAERRLYQRLKSEHILRQIEEEKLRTMDDIVASLDQLMIIKCDDDKDDSKIDDLIDKLEGMKLKATTRSAKVKKEDW